MDAVAGERGRQPALLWHIIRGSVSTRIQQSSNT